LAAKQRSTTSRPEAGRSLMQRGIDTAAEMSDVLAQKLSSAADPRAKQLRKRKWALWLGLFFAVSSLIWVGVTVLLATWSTPAWALFIPAPIAVGAAFLATLCFLRYRWLRGEPLPPQRSRATRRLPPWGSAARQPMAALAASERGLFSLISVLERGKMLPAGELREVVVDLRRQLARGRQHQHARGAARLAHQVVHDGQQEGGKKESFISDPGYVFPTDNQTNFLHALGLNVLKLPGNGSPFHEPDENFIQ